MKLTLVMSMPDSIDAENMEVVNPDLAADNQSLGSHHEIHTTAFAQRVLCIPCGEWLSDAEVEHIVTCLKKL